MTEFAISTRGDVVVVVAAFLPVGVGEQLAVLIDDAGVAEHELRVADLAQQDLELVLVPAIVLVGERDEVGRGRARATSPARSSGRSRSARESATRRSADRHAARPRSRRSAPGHEQSSLTTQTQLRWVWARIDSTWRRNSVATARGWPCRSPRTGRPTAQAAPAPAAPRVLDDWMRSERRHGLEPSSRRARRTSSSSCPGSCGPIGTIAPEAAHEAPGRRVRRERSSTSPRGMPCALDRYRLAVQHELQLSDGRAVGHAPAAREQRAAAPGRDRARKREVERGDEPLPRARSGLSDPSSQAAHPTHARFAPCPATDCPRARPRCPSPGSVR